MTSLFRASAALLFCLALTRVSSADTATRAAADALFREAVTLADQGRVADSVEKFRASYELDPARGTLQGWAMAEEKLGRVLDAYTRFQKLLEVATAAGDKARVEFARDRLEDLKIRVPTLTIERGGDVPADTTLTLDDTPLPWGAAGSALPINPGSHRVVAVAPDGRRFSRMIGVSEGARTKVRVTWTALPRAATVEPAAAPAPEAQRETSSASNPLRTAGIAVGAAGLVLAGVGAYLWVDSGEDYDAVSEQCPGGQCPPDAQDQIDRGQRKETWSRVLLIGGGLAVAGGVTLFFVGSRERAGPQVGAGLRPGSVAVFGRF